MIYLYKLPASPLVLDAGDEGGEGAPSVIENTGIALQPDSTHDQDTEGVEVLVRLRHY
jgi:hypothetical protein